ncbi:hypothetical protein [Halosimplex salinum]|uniref:hypothetical protein n=1 Tax=Halosimplex salinum TaxID=1710538 RepID=UPI000F493859|nr:hypothetical protein [Halosimplex salinum]
MQSRNPTTENRQEFEAALGALVRSAERAGVDLDDSQAVAADGLGRWEIDISRVRDDELERSPPR